MYGRYVVVMSLPVSANFSDTVRTCVLGARADVVLFCRVCDLIVDLNFYVCMDDMLLL